MRNELNAMIQKIDDPDYKKVCVAHQSWIRPGCEFCAPTLC